MQRFFLFCALIAGMNSTAQVLLRNVTLIDVENKKMLPSQSVLVENGMISATGKNLTAPAGTKVIDGSGKFLLPGLVDAHIHFFQSGGIYTRPDAIDLRAYKPYKQELAWVHKNMEHLLRRYASAGITTVIDVGSTISFLKQRDSFQVKPYAPTVYMAGPLLTTWEPDAFRNLGEDESFNEMKTASQGREFVQRQLPFKPDFIKIWYIVEGRNTDSAARELLPMVQAVIDEAHKNNLRVAVHATERITAQLAVQAGADFLVHGVDDEPVDDAFVQLLKNKKVVLSPTIVVERNYYRAFGQTYQPTAADFKYALATPVNSMLDYRNWPDTAFAKRYRNYVNASTSRLRASDSLKMANLKKLAAGGVIIATGTDAGNIGTQHVSSYFDELRVMQSSGLDNWELLQASTINGARAMAKESLFGSIKKGKRADMILLDKNPVEDIANLESLSLVINRGEVWHPDSVRSSSPELLADEQLLAYNAHNLEAFLAPYAEDVEIYDFPGELLMKGKVNMRKAYEFLEKTPKLYCRLVNRVVQGNKVIDHEEVWGFGDKPVYAVAIYEMKDGKISKVRFFQ